MAKGSWAEKIAKTKQAEQAQEITIDKGQLVGFIGGATADGADGRVLEDETPLVELKKTIAERPKKPAKEKKPKKPQGRPSRGIETIKKQFEIPTGLADRLVELSELRYGGNQTRALWAVLEGKDKL